MNEHDLITGLRALGDGRTPDPEHELRRRALLTRLNASARRSEARTGPLVPVSLVAASALGMALPSPASEVLGSGMDTLTRNAAEALRELEARDANR